MKHHAETAPRDTDGTPTGPPTAPMTPDVAAVFKSYPDDVRPRLLALRCLIFDTAARTESVGPLTETLKWGQPAYLTAATKSGSTVRIGWSPTVPDGYGLYVHCQTSLIETFRSWFSDDLTFQGNRGVLFKVSDPVPDRVLAICIATALTYHRTKRQKVRGR